ncbi:MAG: hypothetical protein IPN11_15320 [Opitutaceae bacterium]|nr:hypothetical protein [Opitutaceae bacterium]
MKTHQLSWEDSEYTAVLAPLEDGIVQCSIQNNGTEAAHLFLLTGGLVGLVDIEIKDDFSPPDGLLLIVGRIVVEHRRAVREGRTLI